MDRLEFERLQDEVDQLREENEHLKAENAAQVRGITALRQKLEACESYSAAKRLERLARHANEGDDLLERAVAVLQKLEGFHIGRQLQDEIKQLVRDVEHHLAVEGE